MPTRRTALQGALALSAAALSPLEKMASGHFFETAPHCRRQKARLSPAALVAHTKHGRVRGLTNDGVLVFKGVRYGADTAPARFMPPRVPAPWRKTIDALQYGAASPQTSGSEMASEDCLFMNVWTPGLRDGARRPVMFYIHGGAYSSGSGSSPLYDGTRLCQRGNVVVVSVNHRLGVLGYAYLARLGGEAFADSGNVGMLDLVLALRWVRDNIEEFGGDPNNVMVFGQSGGGAKIATMMAMPAAKGLFHRAATMSGQQLTASGPLNATARARVLLEAMKLPQSRLDEIRTAPLDALLAAARATDPIIGRGSLYFGPVLDDRTLTRHPFYPDAPAQSAGIPMIIGNTHDETRSLIGRSDATAFTLTWDQLSARLLPEMRVDISPDRVVAEYRRLYPSYSPTDVFFAATTASRSWRAAIVEAELRAAQGSPVYAYQLDWASPQDGGKWGAPHTLDIPLVFDNLDKPGSITGTAEGARSMANQMSEAFIAFARTGNPNTKYAPNWVPYSLAQRETMVFNVPSQLVNDPRGAERQLFAHVPFIQQGT